MASPGTVEPTARSVPGSSRELYAVLGEVIPGTPPSRACRPETAEFARFTKQQARPLWNRAVARMEATLPLEEVAILAETDPIRHMRLVQTLAILFYERECVGKSLARYGVPVSPIMMAKPSGQRLTKRVSEVLGWPATQSAHSLARRLKPNELRDILEYLLCVDYGVKRPNSLDSLGENSSRSFAYVAALLFEFIELCDQAKPSLEDLIEIQTACDTIHVWAQGARLNATDLAMIMLNFHLCSSLVTPNCKRVEELIAPKDVSLAPGLVAFIPDHGKSCRHGLTTYSGCLGRLVDALKYGSGHKFVPGARERLHRKLSVDLNEIIPSMVFDGQRQDAMVRILTELARTHNIAPLALDQAYPLLVPEPDAAPSVLDNIGNRLAGVALSYLTGNSKQKKTGEDVQKISSGAGETSGQQSRQDVPTVQSSYRACTAAFERVGRWILEERSKQRQDQEEELTHELDQENLQLRKPEPCARDERESEELMRWQMIDKEEVEDKDSIEMDPEDVMVTDTDQAQAAASAIEDRCAKNKHKDGDGG
ncbi:hypothetical protein MCOR25_006172 [Pyricularia grisea]|uniref:Uncharacterized protein n=1 Tax=Pyricularia grisea TaxID=148305 RepID=A0A6P8BHV5_PYRGI|nr:uncharacterized protein PgNI_01533 [Pyricularia grisea]KAI6362536.1 hypothetical protein MCOR25_006172 [Pyricularia grisea]TLD16358.1 hypothetical protein PgNI_01533 [Pyricularia grisea]